MWAEATSNIPQIMRSKVSLRDVANKQEYQRQAHLGNHIAHLEILDIIHKSPKNFHFYEFFSRNKC